jgi:hypothetical protein
MAPPPMIAPPHVQAQSFANAIRTDITSILFLGRPMTKKGGTRSVGRRGGIEQMQTRGLSASALTMFRPKTGWIRAVGKAFVPIVHRPMRGVNRRAGAAGPNRSADRRPRVGLGPIRGAASDAEMSRSPLWAREDFRLHLSDLCLTGRAAIGRAGAGGFRYQHETAPAAPGSADRHASAQEAPGDEEWRGNGYAS